MRTLTVTIDRSALVHNYAVAQQRADGASVFAVVKADAYGHGAVEAAKALTMADAFAVVTTNEAIQLRDAGIDQPILVLQGPTDADQLQHYATHELWPSIHDEQQLVWVKQSAFAKQLPFWLKVDTGMGRLGVTPTVAERELTSGDINWVGLLTHFASADDRASKQVTEQANQFAALQKQFPNLKSSISNSAGILSWPDVKADWLRPGLMLYGSSPFDNTTGEGESLKPVMRVTAPLISIKNLPKGASVGYAHQYHCPEDMPVGYAGAGYGDGLPRVLDSTATLLVHGIACPVIGRVSMDSMAVDLRPVVSQSSNKVAIGDEVVFWGPEHPVELLAAAAGTISYELLTHVRAKRQYR